MKTLILGLGNPILSDDGVGIRIADELSRRIGTHESVSIIKTSWAGLNLLDFLDNGFGRVVIIDAIKDFKGIVGEMYKLGLDDLGKASLTSFSHNVDLRTAIELGKRTGHNIPKDIDIYAIEVNENTTFQEDLSPRIESKIEYFVTKIIKDIIGS
jgi:hydrogenase maturation protease